MNPLNCERGGGLFKRVIKKQHTMTFLEYSDAIFKMGIHINKAIAELQMHSPMGIKTDLISVSPLSISCSTMRRDDEAEYEALKWAIDFDKWQHSWHSEIKPENYEHFLEVIQGQVIEKSEALVKLNAVAMYLNNKIEQLKKDEPYLLEREIKCTDDDYLPF